MMPIRSSHNFIQLFLHCFLFIFLATCSPNHNENKQITFDVNFVVLSGNPAVNTVVTQETARKEIDILNTYFVSEDKTPLVHFRLKTFFGYDDIKDSQCRFIEIGDFTGKYVSQYWQDFFNDCRDQRVVDPTAINFYINDSYSAEKGFSEQDSHGKNNRNKPYIVLDWERLNHKVQSPEEHEMGHAFGLDHECVPGATMETSTNIMASAECGKGSGGKRDIGFNEKQIKIIQKNAKRIAKKLSKN